MSPPTTLTPAWFHATNYIIFSGWNCAGHVTTASLYNTSTPLILLFWRPSLFHYYPVMNTVE